MEIILVVEDRQLMQQTLRRLFKSAGMWVQTARDGASGLESFRRQPPNAVLLDLNLPSMPGRELCRIFKREAPSIPVVVLSGHTNVGEKVLLLELGADDYVTKPFSPQELLARVRRALRRNAPVLPSTTKSANGTNEHDILTFGNVWIDFTSLEAVRGNRHVSLTALEFKLLKLFAALPGTAISRETILARVWRSENLTTRTVDNLVLNLRQKLEPDPTNPRHFLTVYQVGYQFRPTEDRVRGKDSK